MRQFCFYKFYFSEKLENIAKMANTKEYALVTGAAAGMGREYVRLLAGKGYGIIAVDINGQGLERLKEESRTDDFIAITKDLASPSGAEELISEVEATGVRVAILINNAGIFSYRDITDQPEGYIAKITTLHNITMGVLSRHFAKRMKEHGEGRILNISSLSAWMPYPGIALYAATKRYTKDFSRALGIELRGSGVSVTVAYFGAVATPLIGLSPKYMKLAKSLHVMITPEKAAEKALKAMFRRKNGVMPGTINHIGKPFLTIMPKWLLSIIDRKLSVFKK